MLPRIIFCTAVLLATLAVALLALFSATPQRKNSNNNTRALLALSLYIQRQPQVTSSTQYPAAPNNGARALVFHRTLTEGPDTTSRRVGKANGFFIPNEYFSHSAFNIIYLTFHTHDYSGSIGIQAKDLDYHKDKQELIVVGGTGSFAFARGLAVFAQSKRQEAYHIKLQLKFPNRSQTIAG